MSLTDQLQLRAHDLPPLWDGLAVIWRGWEPSMGGVVFICPPPKIPAACEGCGSLEYAKASTNRGMVALARTTTHQDIAYELANDRRLGSIAYKRKSIALWRLRAWRCPDCGLDTVWDTDVDQWWTLDLSDYGDSGSTEPADSAPSTPAESRASRQAAIARARAAIQPTRQADEVLF